MSTESTVGFAAAFCGFALVIGAGIHDAIIRTPYVKLLHASHEVAVSYMIMLFLPEGLVMSMVFGIVGYSVATIVVKRQNRKSEGTIAALSVKDSWPPPPSKPE